MPMVYIASRLENIEQVRKLRDLLEAECIFVTYDWTRLGPVRGVDAWKMRSVASAEMWGVVNADLVVALLPGGRGTHCEIGAAIASNTPVILYGPPALFGTGSETSAFYHHPMVKRHLSNSDDLETLVIEIKRELGLMHG